MILSVQHVWSARESAALDCGAAARLALASVLVLAGVHSAPARAAEYFVSNRGSDNNDGRTPANAWRSIARVNMADLKPGDIVRLRRGDVWRGQLVPHSGDKTGHVTYSAYGNGAKPLLLGSVEKNDPADWKHDGGNVWSTVEPAPTGKQMLKNASFDKDGTGWNLYHEKGASASSSRDTASYHSAPAGLRVRCAKSGKNGSDIQLYTDSFAVKRGGYYRLTFWAKCTTPLVVRSPLLMQSGSPWQAYSRRSGLARARIGQTWVRCQQYYASQVTADNARLTLFLGGILPDGATFWLDDVAFVECRGEGALPADVGNIIFDDEASCGVKVWEAPDLKTQGQYWYDEDRHVLKLYSKRNPAEHYSDIECAVRRHIIDQSNRSYVIYEDLALKYGGAHGIGGGGTHHVIVRDCDFGYIGGGDQSGGDRTVRFGNGVEFWGNAHDHLVERCRLWEVYDAALTNQSNGPRTRQINIVYRHNLIWNCEYSFEYWNRPENSLTRNVRFENNTCINAGHGWGHTQRPDPSGRHLCFYTSPAAAEDVCVRNNVFYEAKSNALYAPTWPKQSVAGLKMDHNCWFQAKGTMIRFAGKNYTMAQFAAYQSDTGMEPKSMTAEPSLRDPAKLDFHLKSGSPCIDAGADLGWTRDVAGTPIPQGAAPDVGAYEWKP